MLIGPSQYRAPELVAIPRGGLDRIAANLRYLHAC
jgi:hypothetical protein